MADYADLMRLEKKAKQQPQNIPSSASEKGNHTATLPANPQTHMSASGQVDKPARSLVDKSASGQTHKVTLEKPERYTTRLLPSMVKKIKVYALENDVDHYDVVQKALDEFFEKNK